MPPIPGIRVVRSSIDGYGVVATRDFGPGEIIAHVEGVAWRADENRDDRYSLLVDDELFYDMVDQTRWINHSCDPNCEVEVGEDDKGEVWAYVVAIKPIRSGEELSYDYAFSAEVAEPCRCGTANCRGWIIDPDEMHLLKRRAAGG